MNYTVVAALAIFVTLVVMVKRPRGLRLGYAAEIDAVASLILWVELSFGRGLQHS